MTQNLQGTASVSGYSSHHVGQNGIEAKTFNPFTLCIDSRSVDVDGQDSGD